MQSILPDLCTMAIHEPIYKSTCYKYSRSLKILTKLHDEYIGICAIHIVSQCVIVSIPSNICLQINHIGKF